MIAFAGEGRDLPDAVDMPLHDVPPALSPYLVEKGSLAVDGISLTIARLHATHAGFQIVPHTLAHTSLGLVRPGDPVNVECDIIGKYVVNAVRSQQS